MIDSAVFILFFISKMIKIELTGLNVAKYSFQILRGLRKAVILPVTENRICIGFTTISFS